MKFPRNARILRSQIDVTPFAAVFFLLVIFLMIGALLPVPGVPLQIPDDDDLPGADQPTVTVAMDAPGQLYFENQIVQERDLESRLKAAAKESPEPLTLVVQADKAVTYENLVRLYLLARHAGIHGVLFATRPRLSVDPDGASAP